jgi:hypothetical protein
LALLWYTELYGDSWEDRCNALLALKHGADYQPIGDKGGDLGLDAYTLALHVSRTNSAKSNHPNVSVFDEPAQQNMDKSDHLELYPLIAEVCKKGGQVIVAATDKDHAVRAKAQELGMSIIDFGSNYVLSES